MEDVKNELRNLKNTYGLLKKLPRSKWGESAIEWLLATANVDPRVNTIAFLNKRDEQGMPLFNIVSKEVTGEHAGSTIAGRLEESQEERKARLEKYRYMYAMFEDVKVGDTVYTQDKVWLSYNQMGRFWTPKKVARVTKTQFILEDGTRFHKKNGNEVGNNYKHRELSNKAKRLGDIDCFGQVVTDQTQDKEAFVSLVNEKG